MCWLVFKTEQNRMINSKIVSKLTRSIYLIHFIHLFSLQMLPFACYPITFFNIFRIILRTFNFLISNFPAILVTTFLLVICLPIQLIRFEYNYIHFGGKLAMTSKNTRFAEKTDVYQYTDTKSNNDDDEWLLSSPIETGKRRDNNVRAVQPQRQATRAVVVPQEPIVEFKEVIQEPSFVDSEILAMRRQLQKVKLVQKDKPTKETNAPNTHKPHASNPEPERKGNDIKNGQDVHQQISKQVSTKKEPRAEIEVPSKKEPEKPVPEQQLENLASPVRPNHTIIEGILNIQNGNDKRKDRVTKSSKEWFKEVLQSAVSETEKNKTDKQCAPNSTLPGNSRVTMDLKGISSLFEENYNKYEALSSNKNREIISRASVGRKSISFRTASINFLPIQQYFQNLEFENTEDDAIEEKYYSQLEEASNHRVKTSQAKLARLQEELRGLEKQLNSLPSQPQQLRYSIQDYQASLEPLKYLQYKYSIQILVFDVSSQDNNSIYCEFIIDSNIFCKLKRDEHSKKAQVRMTYSTIVDIVPFERLIDIHSHIDLLKVYFATYLDKLSSFEMIQHLGAYNEEFSLLEDDLARCCLLFSVKSLQLTGSCEKLTFQLSIKPDTNIHVIIKLLHLLQPNYYEFYHIEARKQIVIPQEKLKGDDLIDIIEALVDFVS